MFARFMRDGILPDPPSCGNGAAMRISPLGCSAKYTMKEIMDIVENLTLQTHKHPEAVKGAQAVVFAIKRFLESTTKASQIALLVLYHKQWG